jgi:hypothetical protein
MEHHQRSRMARRLVVFVVCLGVFVMAPRAGYAQASSLSVSNSPAALHILGAAGGAGGLPAPAVNGATTYTVKVQNKSVKKITVQLSSNMPAGVTLKVSLTPPTGSSSIPVSLNTTVTDAVTNITTKQSQTLPISYTLNATLAAGVVGSQSRTVTFTLIDFP